MKSNLFYTQEADIYQIPPASVIVILDEGTDSDAEITLSIMYGNALKLIYMLMEYGVLTNIDHRSYERLVKIYKKNTQDLKKKDLEKFNNILNKAKVESAPLIRLMGSVLASSGSNDYFTLKVLQKLDENNVDVEILLSGQPEETTSLNNLEVLVEKRLVSQQGLKKLVNESYKPKLKVISYSLNSLDYNPEITIYSHAGVGLNTIAALAAKLGIEYQDHSLNDIMQTIDAINAKFREHVTDKTLRDIINNNPVLNVIDNDYNNLERPTQTEKYKIKFVHSRDNKDNQVNNENIFSLYDQLGENVGANRKKYAVLVATEDTMPTHSDQQPVHQQPVHQQPVHQQPVHQQPVHNVAKGKSNDQKEIYKPSKELIDRLEKVKVIVDDIRNKANELSERKYEEEADDAEALCRTVEPAIEQLKHGRITGEYFQALCSEAVKLARPRLEQFRDRKGEWKKVLGNLALAVAGVGVLYVGAGLINKKLTGRFLFFPTASASKLDKFEKAVEKAVNDESQIEINRRTTKKRSKK